VIGVDHRRAEREGTAPALRRPQLFLRPHPFYSVLADTGLATIMYLASYWLRFQGDHLETFFPRTLSTLPLVVVAQMAALQALRAYARLPRVDWLLRVVLGVFAGAAMAAAILSATTGLGGVSRMVFVADALLLSIAAVGWRGAWVLRARARLRATARAPLDDELVDRSEEMTTLGAVFVSIFSYRELLKNLVLKDLKLKYRGSVFGFIWSLANPLLMIVVYALAFTYVLRVRSERFVFYLMLGQLSWTFFANSASMSTGSIVENSGLIKSVFFPRAILPVGTVLFNLAQYVLTVSVFLPAMLLWYQVPLATPMALFPVFLALQTAFTIGVALILATATAFLRDIRHLLEVALAALFWATPILYELRQVPERLRLLILLSPMSPFIVAYQKLFFYREWPEPTVWLVAAIYAVGAFIIGTMLILAFEDRFTEQV
jgi:ABC-2 type transport system permease protein